MVQIYKPYDTCNMNVELGVTWDSYNDVQALILARYLDQYNELVT